MFSPHSKNRFTERATHRGEGTETVIACLVPNRSYLRMNRITLYSVIVSIIKTNQCIYLAIYPVVLLYRKELFAALSRNRADADAQINLNNPLCIMGTENIYKIKDLTQNLISISILL